MYKFITDSFVENIVKENPKPLNELGEFVYYRTYSRWSHELSRREYWHETCQRAVNYNMNLEYDHMNKIGYKPDIERMTDEARKLFKNMYETKQFLSGRTLWVGGTEVSKKYPTANFNCAFLNVNKWDDMVDLFHMLLLGTGVGFKCTKEMAANLPPIRTNTTLINAEYEPVPKHQRLEDTKLTVLDNGYAKIYVGDSKGGWVESLRYYFKILTEVEYENIHTIKISYNSVRPKGERLNTFGGTASGPEPLSEMFAGIDKTLKSQLDNSLEPLEIVRMNFDVSKIYSKVRPIHILDIGNLIGANVVVGGVRRTAEVFLFDPDDYEVLLAKYGINGFWTDKQLEQHKKVGKLLNELGIKPKWFDDIDSIGDGRHAFDHRRMSNNTAWFEGKPDRKVLNLLIEILQLEGEPGFGNAEEAKRRRPNAEGANPCFEILLDSYGLCNLTTVNIAAFVNEDNTLDFDGLYEAQLLSARAGLRMTLTELELPHWNFVQNRDRLIGTSLTGYKDAMELVGYNMKDEEILLERLGEYSRFSADQYANYLRVSTPLLATTVKPEGTISQVAGGVSSGLHYSHSPYYIRRIRINSHDPLAQVAKELGWTINAEVGTLGETNEEKIKNARTLVINFPIASGSKVTKDDISAKEQLDNYFNFQKHYTEHNSSNTISVKPHEWEEIEEIIFNNWDEFVGVSFLSHDGGTYELAPYEAITKEEYEQLKSSMKPFDPELLKKYEKQEVELDVGNESCEGGACPIR